MIKIVFFISILLIFFGCNNNISSLKTDKIEFSKRSSESVVFTVVLSNRLKVSDINIDRNGNIFFPTNFKSGLWTFTGFFRNKVMINPSELSLNEYSVLHSTIFSTAKLYFAEQKVSNKFDIRMIILDKTWLQVVTVLKKKMKSFSGKASRDEIYNFRKIIAKTYKKSDQFKLTAHLLKKSGLINDISILTVDVNEYLIPKKGYNQPWSEYISDKDAGFKEYGWSISSITY